MLTSLKRSLRAKLNDPASVFPGLGQYKDYKSADLTDDFFGGITMFFTLIPQSIAYANLAGMPAIYGVYASTFPLYIYALFGTSRHLVFGPYAVTSFMLGSIVAKYPFEAESKEYIHFTLFISFMGGVLLMIVWYTRLGRLVSFITPTVTSGFITGSAFLVALHQVPSLLGYKLPHHEPWTHEFIITTLSHIQETTGVALAFSIPTSLFLYVCGKYKKKRKLPTEPGDHKLYHFVSYLLNISIFIAFVVGTLVSYAVLKNNPESRLLVVGHIPKGFLPSQFNISDIDHDCLLSAIPNAMTVAVVALMSNWSVAKKFSEMFKYEVDSQSEIFSYGILNVVSSLFLNSFFNAAGMARSAVASESGSKTQMSNVICATFIIISLYTVTDALYYIPLPVLGSIIYVSILNMIDYPKIFKLYRDGEKLQSVVMTVTTLCTSLLGVTQGLVLGIFCSIGAHLYRNSLPRVYPLGISTLKGRDGTSIMFFIELNAPWNSEEIEAELSYAKEETDAEQDMLYSNFSPESPSSPSSPNTKPQLGRMLSVGSIESGKPNHSSDGEQGGVPKVIPGIVMARIDCDNIYFGNAGFVKEQLTSLTQCWRSSYLHDVHSNALLEEVTRPGNATRMRSSKSSKRVLIVDISRVLYLDERSLTCFTDLRKELLKKNILFALVHDQWPDDMSGEEQWRLLKAKTEDRSNAKTQRMGVTKALKVHKQLQESGFASTLSVNMDAVTDPKKKGGKEGIFLFGSLERAVKYYSLEVLIDSLQVCMKRKGENGREGNENENGVMRESNADERLTEPSRHSSKPYLGMRSGEGPSEEKSLKLPTSEAPSPASNANGNALPFVITTTLRGSESESHGSQGSTLGTHSQRNSEDFSGRVSEYIRDIAGGMVLQQEQDGDTDSLHGSTESPLHSSHGPESEAP